MVAGIDKYADLNKRMMSELRQAGTSCTKCQRSGIINKYRVLVAARMRRDRTTK